MRASRAFKSLAPAACFLFWSSSCWFFSLFEVARAVFRHYLFCLTNNSSSWSSFNNMSSSLSCATRFPFSSMWRFCLCFNFSLSLSWRRRISYAESNLDNRLSRSLYLTAYSCFSPSSEEELLELDDSFCSTFFLRQHNQVFLFFSANSYSILS